MEKQDLKKNTNRYKGDEGENLIFSSLEKILPSRDGYNIYKTSTIGNNSDIKISRIGYNDISIEIKAHKESIRTSETRKFESDITGLQTHGIFVSLYSSICSKGEIEFDLLSTGKFVIYLSNNQDANIIKEWICLIYKLDELCKFDNFTINQETIIEIKRYLDHTNNQIAILRSNAKINMSAIEELSSSISCVITLLLKNTIKNTKTICTICGNEFTSKGLSHHMNFCKKKNASKDEINEEKSNKFAIYIENGLVKL